MKCTSHNGNESYECQKKNIFGSWKTILNYDAEYDTHFLAIFSTLEEAKTFIVDGESCIKKEVVFEVH